MPTYRYIGGPCNGRSLTTSQPLADNAQVKCGGATYEFNSGNPGVVIWLDVGTPTQAAADALNLRQVFKAWHKLTHTLGAEAPAAVRRSRAGRARMKRAVR